MSGEVHSALVTTRRRGREEDGGPSGRRGRVGGESHKEHLSRHKQPPGLQNTLVNFGINTIKLYWHNLKSVQSPVYKAIIHSEF